MNRIAELEIGFDVMLRATQARFECPYKRILTDHHKARAAKAFLVDVSHPEGGAHSGLFPDHAAFLSVDFLLQIPALLLGWEHTFFL
jgi:hypothetical protein